MLNIGIAGATGYAGQELINILLNHPQARITSLQAMIEKPKPIQEIFPAFKNRIGLICKSPDEKELIDKCDVVFLALPHTVSMSIAPKLLTAGKTVIDLSADYRLKDPKVYEKYYGARHQDKDNLKKSVYGLPEIYKEKIKKAKLVANPGCYPTAAILGLAPIIALFPIDTSSIIIDAKSGTTGAGRRASEELIFSEVDEDFRAYKVNCHQHAPEMDQELSKLSGKKICPIFVPHLLPLKRGILETIYLKLNAKSAASDDKIIALYKKFYKNEQFIRVHLAGSFPKIKDVVGTNFCDIGIKVCGGNIIIISAIDNLIKGASGQAVQNLNIIYGFPESKGFK